MTRGDARAVLPHRIEGRACFDRGVGTDYTRRRVGALTSAMPVSTSAAADMKRQPTDSPASPR
ncbi:hypothetical protein CA830_12560 [Burkholderia multivorans]|nr:hypothetical protein CA830_12560 [Burkholderia multivorans]